MWRPSTPTAGAPRAHCSLSVSPKVEKSFRFFESRGGDGEQTAWEHLGDRMERPRALRSLFLSLLIGFFNHRRRTSTM